MSAKSFAADLCRAAGTDNSHETREDREKHLTKFAEWCWKSGYQLHQVAQIRDKHIGRYVQSRLADGISKRTLQNEMANLRKALRGAGRARYADGPTISNERLGISGASRIGTKTAMANEDLTHFRTAAAQLEPGVAIALDLQRYLGLREKEAVMSVASLKDWQRQLAAGGPINVLHGTKGGKLRPCQPSDRQNALQAVSNALALIKQQGGHLIPRGNLKTALERYSYVCRAIGMTGDKASHSLRYAYARDHLEKLIQAGISEKEARSTVSMFLGHGDRRGRWVAMVYAR